MPGPPPAVAACRVAVRRWLREASLPPGSLVLVACSGGADSLALTAAAGFVAPREGLRVGAVVMDHGLQDGSAQLAASVVARVRQLFTEDPGRGGWDGPVEVVQAHVGRTGAGPEADARRARYAALAAAADRLDAAAVLLGHTLDDQAEQVVLGLARGSGARSLAGMARARVLSGHLACSDETDGVSGGDFSRVRSGLFACSVAEGRPVLGRPLLGVRRRQTRQACAELGLEPWDDPHNEDERFTRVRVRRALVDLEADLGPGLAQNLARTAALLRDDADALDEVTQTAYLELGEPPWPVGRLTELPRAVRTRLWRRLALASGSPGTDLTSEHLLSVDELVTRWRGQGPLPLPGGVRAGREGDRVWLVGPT